MSSAVLYMSMSLDGFITGPNEGPDNALGDGGHRLHEWALGTDAETTGHRDAADRLFENLGNEQRALELTRVAQGRDATHLRYRVGG